MNKSSLFLSLVSGMTFFSGCAAISEVPRTTAEEYIVGDSKIKRTKSLLCELFRHKNLFISRRKTIAQ